jgi:hypothetical protein
MVQSPSSRNSCECTAHDIIGASLRGENVLEKQGVTRDVVYVGGPIAPSYMSPNAWGRGVGRGAWGCGVSANMYKYSCAHGAQINLRRSNSIFNACGKGSGSLSKVGRHNVRVPYTVPCAASSPTSDRWHRSTTPGSSLHYSQATIFDGYIRKLQTYITRVFRFALVLTWIRIQLCTVPQCGGSR